MHDPFYRDLVCGDIGFDYSGANIPSVAAAKE